VLLWVDLQGKKHKKRPFHPLITKFPESGVAKFAGPTSNSPRRDPVGPQQHHYLSHEGPLKIPQHRHFRSR
jgi:hypothetical protein